MHISSDLLKCICSSVRCKAILNDAAWLRIQLDKDLEIRPRLDLATMVVFANALSDKTGQPTTWYHGTYGLYALNILSQRHLMHGTMLTSGRSGLWHGPPRKAVEYAWPTKWPKCDRSTMSMFELRVAQHTKHARHVHVNQNVGTYEVSAILLQRYRGSLHEDVLQRDFHVVRNGAEDLAMMWLQGVHEEQPPKPLEQPSDIPVKDTAKAEQDDCMTSNSEGELCANDPMVEDDPSLDPDRVRTPEEEEAIWNFISNAKALAVSRNKPETVFVRYPHRTPSKLQKGDDRFQGKKTERMYACDSCGQLISYSRASRGTGYRADGDFPGAYTDHSWKDLPIELQEEAWNLGLIDCTWYCNAYCDGGITGGGKDRRSRTAPHRAQCKKARSW